MNSEQLLREIEALPEGARRQVVDFVAFLRSRDHPRRIGRRRLPALMDDPFIGMWKDREDMRDGGAAWVRRLRQDEWARRISAPDLD
jgi:hypothetical protein